MSRRSRAVKRELVPDPKYGELSVARFITNLMKKGKRSTAENIIYGALEIIHSRTKDDPMKVFKKALANVRPSVEVKSRRVGGSNYQVPIEVPTDRRQALAMRWISSYARSRKGRSMYEKLAAELFDAAENRGEAVKKREDVHRMAEANKAFAHYRW